MHWILPRHIIVEKNALQSAADRLLDFGGRFLLVTGARSMDAHAHELMEKLRDYGAQAVRYNLPGGEPDAAMVDDCAAFGREEGVRAVIGLGGGSALDTAKAAAALIPNGGPVLDYLEGVGTGRELEQDPLPFIAIPTTAGTGSEATKNAVVMSREAKYKRSIRSDQMMADLILIDPQLMVGMPPSVTAYSGLDAFTQCLESFVTVKGNPLARAVAGEGLSLIYRALPVAYETPGNADAREDMAVGALLSGMALGNSGLGAVHGLAASIGAYTGMEHGLICAILLPHVTEANLSEAMPQYATAFRRMLDASEGSDAADARAGLEALKALCMRLHIPESFEGRIKREDVPGIVRDVSTSSMRGNPVEFGDAFWESFIENIL